MKAMKVNLPMDEEWIALIWTARQLGIHPDMIRRFLNDPDQTIRVLKHGAISCGTGYPPEICTSMPEFINAEEREDS